MINKLDITTKLSQMFMVGIPNIEIDSEVKSFMDNYMPGGIIYYGHNYETPSLLAEYSNELQSLALKNSKLPLFIGVDQEGGRVNHLKKPFTQFPTSDILGDIGSPKLAFDVSTVFAKELSTVGINVNFWPLCDILTRSNNSCIKKRAFGNSADIVTKMSSAVVRGFITARMFACVKHFPGHGDTIIDSHEALPRVNYSWEDLLNRELVPFVKAIKSKTDFIMTAHILNEAIDPEYPATISRITLTEKLRKELRYKGLIIADDLEMKALTDSFKRSDLVRLAINAGVDVLIYKDMHAAREAIESAREQLAKGEIDPEDVNVAFQRIQAAKKERIMPFESIPLDGIREIVGCSEHKALVDAV